ncbi:MAG: ABC transporter permease [Spirochaetaceae bacterium]|nr:ABC transporter permease [Spirochaetaceae bacterium]
MKTKVFASRCAKEILRDPLTIAFGLGFPIVLILLFSIINRSIPQEAGATSLFEINNLAPGMIIFGFSFISLFSAMLVSKDRATSYLLRLFASPLKANNFILGYSIPLLFIAIAQSTICFCFSLIMGLTPTWNIISAILLNIPTSIFFIGMGLLCGSLFNDKQVGGICGALLTNLCAWLSGAWIPLDLIGGIFRKIAYALPFVHAANMGKYILQGNYSEIITPLIIVSAYSISVFVLAIIVFKNKMSSDKM